MNWFDLCVIALAIHQLVNIWRFSSRFAGWREWIETERHRDTLRGDTGMGDLVCSWLTSLHGCPWCLSVNFAIAVWLTYYGPDLIYGVSGVGKGLVGCLAVSQLANLIHHITGHRGPKLNS